jgi:hypothetical protein
VTFIMHELIDLVAQFPGDYECGSIFCCWHITIDHIL